MSNQVLSCENVTASYGAIQALHGVNLEVNEGEIVVVLGANGAGKSTLADIMLYCFLTLGAAVGQPLPEDCTKIAAWLARVGARPSASA